LRPAGDLQGFLKPGKGVWEAGALQNAASSGLLSGTEDFLQVFKLSQGLEKVSGSQLLLETSPILMSTLLPKELLTCLQTP
jgi:hypothetical protein